MSKLSNKETNFCSLQAGCLLNFSYSTNILAANEARMMLGLSTSALIRSLEPATRYECYVAASTKAGNGQPARGMFWTKPNSEINTDNFLDVKILQI